MEPILVILAAGLGSRYGGLKQIDPMGSHGEFIIDYSLFDARRAGFKRVVFLITKELETEFHATIGRRVAEMMEVRYAFQSLADCLPAGFAIPAGRTKPWGTSHALLCCGELIDAPFAVINADDFYGAEAYRQIYDFLTAKCDSRGRDYAMVGYALGNTVTADGSVSRGVCQMANGYLTSIVERTRIERRDGGIGFTEDGERWEMLPEDTLVSMNFWGLSPACLDALAADFAAFLRETLPGNPLKAEYYLPTAIGRQISAGLSRVAVLRSNDAWHGVTNKADRPEVVAAMRSLAAAGLYPEPLWGAG